MGQVIKSNQSSLDIAQGSIELTQLENVTDGSLIVGNGSNVPTAVAMSGDIAIINSGATTIQEGAVEDSMIEALASGELIIGVDGTAANNAKVTTSGDAIIANDGAVTIQEGAVEDSMIEALASGELIIGVDGTAANNAKVTTSGDAIIANDGAVTIQEGAVEDSMIEGLAAGQIILGVDGTAANNLKDVLSGDVTMDATAAVTIGSDKVDPNMKNVGSYIEFVEEFVGSAPDEVATWHLLDTSAAGAPTHAYENDETAVTMTLAANDELEVCGYDFNDALQFDIDDNPIFIARFKTSTITTNEETVIGMCVAWNDTLDNNADHAWFRLKANMDLLIETDDGVNDESEDSTVNMTADVYLWVKIDFADTSNVLFYTGTDGITWTARAPATFDMSNYTGGLQPAFAVLKASGVTQPTITVDAIKVFSDRP